MEEKKQGIKGWELANLDPELFDTRVVAVYGSTCPDCEYLTRCETPCDSIRELVPKTGEVIELGREEDLEGDQNIYYAHVSGQDTRYIMMREPRHLWAKASYVPQERIPTYMLRTLGKNR